MQYWDDGLVSVSKNDELYHFGIRGMKWGVRRYQNEDGSLTPAGKLRYNDGTTSKNARETTDNKSHAKLKTAVKVGAAVAATALTAYGAYKATEILKGKASTKSYQEGMEIVRKYRRAATDLYMKAGGPESGNSVSKNVMHYTDLARKTAANTDARTDAVKKSAVAAAKYLLHPENYAVDAKKKQ